MKEKPKTEKRPEHEIELEQRPEPQEGEAFDVWLKRIGGPNAEIVENLETYLPPEEKAKIPLIINKKANLILNGENLGTYFDKEKIDAEIEKKNPNVRFVKTKNQYQLKKELFKNPELYFNVIGEELKNKQKIVADKGFGENVEKWIKELEKEIAASKGGEPRPDKSGREKPEKKARKKKAEKKSQPKAGPPRAEKEPESAKKEPEKVKKEPTLDEQIAQKQKELEKAEEKMAIYRPLGWFRKKPVVRDLGYYANEAQIKNLKKEIQELKRKKPAASLRMQAGPPKSEGLGGEKKVEEKKEESVKTGVVGSAVGGGIRMWESAEDIENRLQELSAEISTSSVLGRSKLEKEQKKLEKRLKKIKKLKKKKKK